MPEESVDFARGTSLAKALADETRLQIVQILSCGERCACDIQAWFKLSQPTLSHHLGILAEAGLVLPRKEGKWTHYRLDPGVLAEFTGFISQISKPDNSCPCKQMDNQDPTCATSNGPEGCRKGTS